MRGQKKKKCVRERERADASCHLFQFNLILLHHPKAFLAEGLMMMSDAIVTLNVGGKYFATILSTLCVHPQSALAMMFTPPIAALRDSRDGSYFIDRNPKVFGFILDYLRSGTLVVPRDPVLYTLLRREVGFYGLPVAAQLPQIQPSLWEASPVRYKHARIQVDEQEKIVDWDDGSLPENFQRRTTSEIVNFFSSNGYKVASEFASRGSSGFVSIWMTKKVKFPGADVPIEIRDRGTTSSSSPRGLSPAAKSLAATPTAAAPSKPGAKSTALGSPPSGSPGKQATGGTPPSGSPGKQAAGGTPPSGSPRKQAAGGTPPSGSPGKQAAGAAGVTSAAIGNTPGSPTEAPT